MEADEVARSIKTINRIAYNLVDFLNWLNAHGISPERATYAQVLAYQEDIRNGRWGKGNRELSPAWANEKADEACSFLRWFAENGYRAAFTVQTRQVRVPSLSGQGKTENREVRNSRCKGSYDPLHVLSLPSEPAVLTWLDAVRLRRGRSKSLACRGVVELATRKLETCSIAVEQWPTGEEITKAERGGKKQVRIMITNNTKNSRPRAVDFDVQFARIVRSWIDGPRVNLAEIYFRRTGIRPRQLFLSDAKGFEGTPISPVTLYECFKMRTEGGPEIWFPHLGRHYSICAGLIEGLRKEATAMNGLLHNMPLNWVKNRTEYHLNIQRRKAGHLSAATTEIYTQWVETNLILRPTTDEWHSFLETGDSACQKTV
ncbi:hypothetical protein [Rhizobium sp. Root1220]|uniref:hypothetical protein n=1 Tax=Rhizobium sp. Root1220 TaxID=1736432 RepID=UPI0006F2391C|nr:hypothetical protein [Rhizobium sp. Root1220]KQV83569.1 hypothetical protein ASC90_19940 [Rhizobium sp. Root1220]